MLFLLYLYTSAIAICYAGDICTPVDSQRGWGVDALTRKFVKNKLKDDIECPKGTHTRPGVCAVRDICNPLKELILPNMNR